MSSYWAKRADERITEAHNDLTLNIKEALVSYDQSLIEIESDIKRLLFKGNLEMYDLNDVLSVQASKKEVDNLFSMLEKATNKNEIKRLKNEISKLAYKARITRLTAIKANIEARVAHLGGVTENLIRDKLTTTAGVMYDKTIFDLQQQIGFAFPFMKSSNEMIDTIINQDWSGKHWSERVWANSKELSVNLFDTMIKGVAQGKSYYVMSKELKDKMQSSEYAAIRLIRTEASYVANRSKLNAYITNGIEKYEFVAVLDARTSEICQDNDGSIVELKDAVFGLTLPPLHPNCRSTFIALIEPEYKASLKRLSVNPITGEKEKIPRDMTYREWKQSLFDRYGRFETEIAIKNLKNVKKHL